MYDEDERGDDDGGFFEEEEDGPYCLCGGLCEECDPETCEDCDCDEQLSNGE